MDITTKMLPLIKEGRFKRRPSDGKFVIQNPVMPWNVPWVYVRTQDAARCHLYHQIFFRIYNHVPSYCRECYKVVIRPRTLVELFDWYEVQRTIIQHPCKCGIERRDSVGALYGAYHYFRGKKAGQEGYKILRKLVDEHLSPETTVLLKRFCTEFEIDEEKGHHPSDKVSDITPEELEWEQWVEAQFSPFDGGSSNQYPEDLLAHIMKNWIHFAYSNGDQTYKEFTDGSTLFPSYITYHNEDEGGVENASNT